MTRFVQLQRDSERRIALVEEPRLRLVQGDFPTIHALAQAALKSGQGLGLVALARAALTDETLDYDAIWRGDSPWRLLAAADHPHEPARCLVSGTGLTHLGSAQDRQAMHLRAVSELTDSMKMFRLGLEGGHPEPGHIGAAPEWFYKGTGTILRAHGEPLDVPAFAEDGGEEGELAGVYLIDNSGAPVRLGMAVGNEFSDHKFERGNYLNLAASKLRTCSIGPELIVGGGFDSVPGRVTIERAGRPLWTKEIATGEANMCHRLSNLEHHHFKFPAHRRPGDLHVHYYGAHTLSFGAGVVLADGDTMEISFPSHGRPLRNPLRVLAGPPKMINVRPTA